LYTTEPRPANGGKKPRFPARVTGILHMTAEIRAGTAVLVVDDEALIRWSLSEALADSGWSVQQASNGAEARRILGALSAGPLVVVLDLRLPDVADLSLLREIRALRPDVPVIMMSAHGTGQHAAEAARLGAYRFVDKPFDVGEMVTLVNEAFSHPRD
jgi:DNA-binding NtrC family response regulator